MTVFEHMRRIVPDFGSDLIQSARHSAQRDNEYLHDKLDPVWLWYAELDMDENGGFSPDNNERLSSLVEANIRVAVGSSIKQDDAAWATIELGQDTCEVVAPSSWLAALGKWDEAISAANQEDRSNPQNIATRMECYHNLADFEENYQLSQEHDDLIIASQRIPVAHWSSLAALAVGDLDRMNRHVGSLKKGSLRSLYK